MEGINCNKCGKPILEFLTENYLRLLLSEINLTISKISNNTNAKRIIRNINKRIIWESNDNFKKQIPLCRQCIQDIIKLYTQKNKKELSKKFSTLLC